LGRTTRLAHGEQEGVVSVLPKQDIRTAVAGNHIIAGAAIDPVIAQTPSQIISAVPALDGVVAGTAADRVIALAAQQGVSPTAADQQVVTASAFEPHGRQNAKRGNDVGSLTADPQTRAAARVDRTVKLDILDRVGADRHAAGGAAVQGQVDTGPATTQDDRVGAGTAEDLGRTTGLAHGEQEGVVAVITVQHIRTAVARDHVIA